MISFAERLQTTLDQAGISRAELSRRSGCCKAAISQYLSGKSTAAPSKIKPLADALGVNVEYLMGVDSSDTPPEPKTAKPVNLSGKITLKQAARCLRMSEKVVARNIQNGTLPIGRALVGTGGKNDYLITPEKLRNEAGEARFNEFFGL